MQTCPECNQGLAVWQVRGHRTKGSRQDKSSFLVPALGYGDTAHSFVSGNRLIKAGYSRGPFSHGVSPVPRRGPMTMSLLSHGFREAVR